MQRMTALAHKSDMVYVTQNLLNSADERQQQGSQVSIGVTKIPHRPLFSKDELLDAFTTAFKDRMCRSLRISGATGLTGKMSAFGKIRRRAFAPYRRKQLAQ
jgi:hypothetical protein